MEHNFKYCESLYTSNLQLFFDLKDGKKNNIILQKETEYR